MELNKSPPLWDWEDLLFSPSRAAPKKMSLLDFEVEAINGFEAGSGSGGSGILETSHSFSQDLSCRKELESACPTRTPSMTDISIGSGESLMGLNLGKRTYFEDMLGGNNSSKMAKVKRSKPSSQSTEVPRCQVEGCNLDLSSDKVYHRKHRVCVTHSKSSKVIIRGLERRFCQQCSRFHNLSEFDQKKRSCRRRLLDHNARRRKPKPEIIQFNTMPLHSSLHEGRNQISFGFNQVPMVQTRPDINSKLIKGRAGLSSPTKIGCSDELQGTWYKPQESDFKFAYGCTQPLRMREVPVQGFHQGVQVPMTMSDIDATQDLRALSLLSSYSSGSCVPESTPQQLELHYSNHDLSLLSTKSWGSFEPDPIPPTGQQSGMLQYHHDRRLGLPEYGQQSISSGSGVEVPTIQSSTHSQQFQLKELNEPSFYMY